jgi:metal-sulfur cluster biosynthetic enzyme
MAENKEVEKIKKELEKIKDPHTMEGLVSTGLIEDVKLEGKNVTIVLKVPYAGCAACAFVSGIEGEIKKKLKTSGYNVDVVILP